MDENPVRLPGGDFRDVIRLLPAGSYKIMDAGPDWRRTMTEREVVVGGVRDMGAILGFVLVVAAIAAVRNRISGCDGGVL
jgi:hypothetical protein